MLTTVDALGAVFAGVPGRSMRPVYTLGLKGAKEPTFLFQCPVSAIPEEVWELLGLWWDCRQLRCLPYAGGLVDQPPIVRRAFVIFENEMRAADPGGQSAERAAALAVGTMVKVMRGGR